MTTKGLCATEFEYEYVFELHRLSIFVMSRFTLLFTLSGSCITKGLKDRTYSFGITIKYADNKPLEIANFVKNIPKQSEIKTG